MNLCIGGAALLFLLSLYLVFFVAYQTKEEPTFSLKVFFIKVFVPRGVGLILGGLILGLIFLFKPQFEASQEEIGLITFSLRLTLNWAIVSFLGYSLVSILKKNCIYLGYRLEVALLVLRYFTLFLHIVLTAAHWGGIFVLVCAISSAAPFVEEVIQGAAERVSELSPSAVVGWPWWKYALVGAGGFVAVGIIIYCCIKYGGGGAEVSQNTSVQSVTTEVVRSLEPETLVASTSQIITSNQQKFLEAAIELPPYTAGINFTELIHNEYFQLPYVWENIEKGLELIRGGRVEEGINVCTTTLGYMEEVWQELSNAYGAENLAWQQAVLPAVEGSKGSWTLEQFINRFHA